MIMLLLPNILPKGPLARRQACCLVGIEEQRGHIFLADGEWGMPQPLKNRIFYFGTTGMDLKTGEHWPCIPEMIQTLL
jgi:hypothetical protein